MGILLLAAQKLMSKNVSNPIQDILNTITAMRECGIKPNIMLMAPTIYKEYVKPRLRWFKIFWPETYKKHFGRMTIQIDRN